MCEPLEDRFYSRDEIATRLQCCKTTLSRRMKELGIYFRERLLTKAQAQMIIDQITNKVGNYDSPAK